MSELFKSKCMDWKVINKCRREKKAEGYKMLLFWEKEKCVGFYLWYKGGIITQKTKKIPKVKLIIHKKIFGIKIHSTNQLSN